MIVRRGLPHVTWPFIVALAAFACAKGAPPAGPPALTIAAAEGARVKAPMTVSATEDANPDSTGRPSPIVVRVYQLKTDLAFNAAEFFALFDDEQKVLGPELISRDEFVLAPAEKRVIDIALAGETRFVGAIAAFRDIRNSQWRALVPAPRKGLTVAVERTRILLSPVE
ncbi:MAG: type VI secretion system lipoprotein TssJ [Vicinamibacterales bacterium]